MTLRFEEATRERVAPVADARSPERPPGNVAAGFAPVLERVLGTDCGIRFAFWDGSTFGAPEGAPVIRFARPDAVRRLIWSPDELGLGRAYVAGDLSFEGDVFETIRLLGDGLRGRRRLAAPELAQIVAVASRFGALGRPLAPPPEEAHVTGLLHSKSRDSAAVTHHYDVGNDFYRIVLGPAMTYSCARFASEGATLEDAQRSKHELICRKLGLDERPGARLLDVGCGWGSMALHAAGVHGARVVGITLSNAQADEARRRAEEAGLADMIEIRLQDYRDLRHETFDAISSVGMFEHVGSKRMDEYFGILFSSLAAGGRLLNHAISRPGGSKLRGRTFINRYVFPDGELVDMAEVVRGMHRAGFEVRDVESLREHYAETLRCWVRNLEESWDEAVRLAGARRARVWRLYMAASANNFTTGPLSIHQVLGVRVVSGGASRMPRTRAAWG